MRAELMIRRGLLASVIAGMMLTSLVLIRFADATLPIHFLVRPLVTAFVVAAALGLLAIPAGRFGAWIAAAGAGFLLAPFVAAILVLLAVGSGAVFRLLRKPVPRARGLFLTILTLFWMLSVGRAVLAVDVRQPGSESVGGDPPVYLVLVDGYPRVDTMAQFGVDLREFIAQLQDRGFDHYPDAVTADALTRETLKRMLDSRELVAPVGYSLIDSPIGHVYLHGGRHLGPDVITDLDVDLLGRTAPMILAPETTRAFVAEKLRQHLDESLRLLQSADESRIFAHLLSPHAPFLFGPGEEPLPMPECWRGCRPFSHSTENLGIPVVEWAALMGHQLRALNGRLIGSIDAILERRPNAVIVLFSDHGSQYAADDAEEQHRSFLAARTPGHPRLFAVEPRPEAVLRIIHRAYDE